MYCASPVILQQHCHPEERSIPGIIDKSARGPSYSAGSATISQGDIVVVILNTIGFFVKYLSALPAYR